MSRFILSILRNLKFFLVSEVVQAKEKSYHDRHPTDHFLSLAIEVFGCLDKQVDVFLHD
jgi:hypothetical protein